MKNPAEKWRDFSKSDSIFQVKEYLTEAVVLEKEALDELDLKITLYSQSLGKVRAKAKSARKMTSKLAGHLEPLNLVKIRLVQKNGFQIADALKFGRLNSDKLQLLNLVNGMVPDQEPDQELWLLVKNSAARPADILRHLGFDPAFANCAVCGRSKPEYFNLAESLYWCDLCHSRSGAEGKFVKTRP